MRAVVLGVLVCGVGLAWAQPARIRCGPAQAGCGPASVLVTATTLPPSGYAEAVRADAPLLYLRLGESSGTTAVAEVGASGTYSGGPTLGQAGAVAGNTAVRLDGVDDLVSLPASLVLAAGSSVTIEWWQYLTAGDVKDALAFVIGPGEPRCQSHAPYADQIVYWDYGDPGGGGRVSTSYAAQLGKWTLIHLTYDAATQEHAISFDGQQVTGSINATAPNATLSGGTISAPGTPHKGVVDEFAVYDKALSPARRLAHFQAAS
jgi:Concanavalin A-like lectin/glucanases superfamily